LNRPGQSPVNGPGRDIEYSRQHAQ
jgi:hypothetical protein